MKDVGNRIFKAEKKNPADRADQATIASRAIIEQEAAARVKKTARLKQMRLEERGRGGGKSSCRPRKKGKAQKRSRRPYGIFPEFGACPPTGRRRGMANATRASRGRDSYLCAATSSIIGRSTSSARSGIAGDLSRRSAPLLNAADRKTG